MLLFYNSCECEGCFVAFMNSIRHLTSMSVNIMNLFSCKKDLKCLVINHILYLTFSAYSAHPFDYHFVISILFIFFFAVFTLCSIVVFHSYWTHCFTDVPNTQIVLNLRSVLKL